MLALSQDAFGFAGRIRQYVYIGPMSHINLVSEPASSTILCITQWLEHPNADLWEIMVSNARCKMDISSVTQTIMFQKRKKNNISSIPRKRRRQRGHHSESLLLCLQSMKFLRSIIFKRRNAVITIKLFYVWKKASLINQSTRPEKFETQPFFYC